MSFDFEHIGDDKKALQFVEKAMTLAERIGYRNEHKLEEYSSHLKRLRE